MNHTDSILLIKYESRMFSVFMLLSGGMRLLPGNAITYYFTDLVCYTPKTAQWGHQILLLGS